MRVAYIALTRSNYYKLNILLSKKSPTRRYFSFTTPSLRPYYRSKFACVTGALVNTFAARSRLCLFINERLFQLQVAETVCKAEPLDVPLKKPKIEDFYNYTMYTIDPYFQAAALYDQYRNSLRSWTNKRPFLSHEPPLLQHPEKVVHLKDSSRFELSYQPNVALKPHQPPTPPSSDEITSSTSPPPVAEVAPPPDCELSTDTDDEDCKDLVVETAAHLLTDGDQSHIRKAQMVVEDKDAIIAEQAETIREKDAIIARQLELLKEKEALILKREQELREKEALVSEQAERLTLIEKRPVETTAEKPPTIEIVERPDEAPRAEEAETSKRECE